METPVLDYIFDPSSIGYFYSLVNKKQDEESERVSKKFKDEEKEYFREICKELTKDILGLGLSVNFSSKILIRKVAMNIILLKKVIFQMSGTTLAYDIPKKIIPLKNGLTTTHTPFYHEINIHPFFERLIFKLQEEIDKGLEKLGLLPLQQIERQKLTIIKKLRQRYENISGEVSIEARKETNAINRKVIDSSVQS